jgi:hypothetical protein
MAPSIVGLLTLGETAILMVTTMAAAAITIAIDSELDESLRRSSRRRPARTVGQEQVLP